MAAAEGNPDGTILTLFVYDRRRDQSDDAETVLRCHKENYNRFLNDVRWELDISPTETFVITTTDRKQITSENFDQIVKDKMTLYLLQRVDQLLTSSTKERIEFLPHYNTLLKSGTYEYYASKGQNPLHLLSRTVDVVARRQPAELAAESDSEEFGKELGPVLGAGENSNKGSASEAERELDSSETEEQLEPIPVCACAELPEDKSN